MRLDAPYIPGFLAFREVPHLLHLIDRLRNTKPEFLPQVILVDGNGIFHQNGFGLASHLGVLANIPTIGCGKTVFFVDGISSVQQIFMGRFIKYVFYRTKFVNFVNKIFIKVVIV